MTNMSGIHQTETCDADNGKPCAQCQWADKQERGQLENEIFQNAEQRLRRTRSIVHHWEMTEEQKRRDTCSECHHQNSVDLRGHCQEVIRDPVDGSTVYCGCKCTFLDPSTRQNILDAIVADKAIDALGNDVQTQRLITPSSFDAAWDAAPESMRRVTEIEAGEFFYYAGRRDRETELLAEMNETLRGVAERIGAERLR